MVSASAWVSVLASVWLGGWLGPAGELESSTAASAVAAPVGESEAVSPPSAETSPGAASAEGVPAEPGAPAKPVAPVQEVAPVEATAASPASASAESPVSERVSVATTSTTTSTTSTSTSTSTEAPPASEASTQLPTQGAADDPAQPSAQVPVQPPARQSRRAARGKAPIGLRLKLVGELGALGVLYHGLRLSETGTYFDLRTEGRQDTMFLFGRVAAELEVDDHHEIILLYQPLRFRTETVLRETLVADNVSFAPETGLEIFYGFDFYRVSYAYDFFTDPGDELAIGFGLQFRNFRGNYVSADGEQSVANSNFGPVPAIKLRGRHELDRVNFWYGGELDGFYANIPFINGGEDPVEGAIIDASLRMGVTVARIVKPYLNVRYVGGGARGTNSDKVGFGDGFTNNWIHVMAASVGVELAIPVIAGDRAARDAEIAARKAKRRARRGR